MRKLWLVAKREYLRRVGQKSFLIAVLGMPLMIFAVAGIAILVAVGGGDGRPVGYIDHAGVLVAAVLPELQAEQRDFIDFRAYPDETAARAVAEQGTIQAYYVLPEDYLASKQLTVYYTDKAPSDRVSSDFRSFLRLSLAQGEPAGVRDRLANGFNLVVRSATGQRELNEGNALTFLIPFAAAFFLFFAIASAGGYLLQAVTEEKENRTVEIITTSVSPEQLMGGKALGLMGVSLTQILVWVVALAVGMIVGGQFYAPLRAVKVPWSMLIITLLYFVPTFAVIDGVMTTIGAAVTELQQGQQISGLINMLFIMPVFFVTLIFTQPNSPLLVALTLFPTSAFLTILLRTALASVPMWQMAVSWVLLVGTAVASVWVAGRVFRMGMLRYGQRLNLGNIIEGLRHPGVVVEKEASHHA